MNKNAIVDLCSLMSVPASEDDTASMLTEKLTNGIISLTNQLANYESRVQSYNSERTKFQEGETNLLERMHFMEEVTEQLKQQLDALNSQGDQDQDDYRDTTDEHGMPDTHEAKRLRDLNTLCKRLGIPERTDPLWDSLNIGVNGDVFWVWFPRDLYGTSKETNPECYAFMGRIKARAQKIGLVAWFRNGALNIRTMKRNFTPM